MERQYYSPEKNGFYGAFYECPSDSDRAMILMLGDAIDDRMAMSGTRWLHQQKCHVMAMSPDKIYIGGRLPDEYTGSESRSIRSHAT